MNRFAGRKKQSPDKNDRRIRKSPVLEPACGVKTGKRRKYYSWTPEKVERLEELAAKGLTNREIADELNEEFTEEAQANEYTVDGKLSRDVYRRRPELKRIEQSEPYEWTPEKVERLEELVAERLTDREIADKLNEEFPRGVRANEQTVKTKLKKDVYRRRPELKRRQR